MKEHEFKCGNANSASSLASSIGNGQSNPLSPSQSVLTQHGFRQSRKLNDKDNENMKLVCAQWISKDLRPFSIIEDSGFRNLAQELVRIGTSFYFIFVTLKEHLF